MTAITTAASDEHTLILRHRLRTDGPGAVVLGGGFFVVMMAVTAAASLRAPVTISAWEAGSHVIRWFIGAMGVYCTAVYLPLYVAYGRTRRDAARQLGLFGVLYAGIAGLVMAVGYLLERGIYGLAGWSQGLDEGVHLFASSAQAHLVFTEHALLYAVWLFAGGLLGVAFYRHAGIGTALIPAGVLAVGATEAAIGAATFSPLPPPLYDVARRLFGDPGVLLTAVVALAMVAGLAAAAWPIARALPLGDEPS